MIEQPQFPQSFKQLILTIINEQLDADQIKDQINPAEARGLFNRIDTFGIGKIGLENFLNFLKANRISITQKEMKFISKYFGFENNVSFTFEDFQEYFLQVKNPKNKQQAYSQSALHTFLQYIAFIAQSFSKIEDVKFDSAANMAQLHTCLQQYYEGNRGVLSNEIVKECLFDLGLYSRLNVFMVCHHMIGFNSHQITLKALFSKEDIDIGLATIDEVKQVQSISKLEERISVLQKICKEDIQPISTIFNMETPSIGNSKVIFSEIQNIQRQKNEKPLKHEFEEKHIKKPIGTLIKKSLIRNSMNNQSEDWQNMKPSLIASEKSSMKMINTDTFTKIRLSDTTAAQISNKDILSCFPNLQLMEKLSMNRINSRTTTSRVNEYISRQICPQKRPSRYKGQIRLQYASLQKK